MFDRDGNLYVTYSGTRGDHAPVSIFRVGSDGSREPFASGIPNATSMAFDPLGQLYVSSRFEGRVYRVSSKGEPEVAATELGVASGIAFDADGTLFVGDRSGTIFRVDAAGSTVVHASLPPSIAAYHLAHGPDGCLYVTAPTLAPADVVYRIDPSGNGGDRAHRVWAAAGPGLRLAGHPACRRGPCRCRWALPVAARRAG